eukprot:10409699-Ditylum_brightwellii.AAC.1
MILLSYSPMLYALPGDRQFLLADKMIRQEFELDGRRPCLGLFQNYNISNQQGNNHHAVTLHDVVFEPSTPFNHVATYLSLVTDMAHRSSVGINLAEREESEFEEEAYEDNNSNKSLHLSQEEEEMMTQVPEGLSTMNITTSSRQSQHVLPMPYLVLLETDGGPEHSTTFLNTQLSLLAIFILGEMDKLVGI